MLTKDEKKYLKALVEKQLEDFKKREKIADFDTTPVWVKGTDDYEKFLKEIMEKLKNE